MASRAENRVVNLAGLVQGITLVTFPAASSIFTAADGYDLSNTLYGAMFLPQVLTAITMSLLGVGLAHRISAKRVLLIGLAANIISMVVLVLSTGFESDLAVAYPMLLVATAFLGAGFGLTVPVLNTFVAAFTPDRADRAVLVLNALLGLGTALAPVFVAVFVGLGFWWGLPVLSTILLVLLLLASARLPLRADTAVAGGQLVQRAGIPPRFWLFAAFAVLYGICETMNGNWSQQDMTSELGASATQASLALTAFWAMVTVGRLLFAAIARWLPTRVVYHLLPIVLVATFTLIANLPNEIAFYQVGYGIAAFGVGPLVDQGTSLSTIYGWTAVAAAAMTLLSFAVARHQPSPERLHPGPTGHPHAALLGLIDDHRQSAKVEAAVRAAVRHRPRDLRGPDHRSWRHFAQLYRRRGACGRRVRNRRAFHRRAWPSPRTLAQPTD
jgi:MFS family permease